MPILRLALLGLAVLTLSGCFGARVVEDDRMRHIAQQARDMHEVGKALEHGAEPELWGPFIQRMSRAIFKLTGEEWGEHE